MTISTEVRKAGPFIGNGSASSFPFAFKVFKAADLIVVRRQDNIGVETTLVLDSDYHVTLNVNQDTTPGGVVALTGGALADGFTLIVSSELPYLQTTDLTNQGGFYPKVITNALDRLTIFCQQLAENLGRTLKLPITAPTNISTEIPLPNPSELLAWNETGTGLTTVSPQSLVTSIAYGTATADLFAGDGVTTTFPLTTNPASVNNLDVSIGGYSQRPVQDGVGDYSWNGGASITFVVPPPAPTAPGDKNVLVRYMQAIPVSDSEALHAQTREALRRSYAEAGFNLVDGSFETGGTLASPTDVLLLESSGVAYAWTGAFPKIVAPGSDPTAVTGYVPRTDVVLRDALSSPTGPLNSTLTGLRDFTSAFSYMTSEQIQDVKNRSASVDVTAALNSAFSGTEPRTVYLPAGVYKITGKLVVRGNLCIVGAGRGVTIIKYIGDGTFSGALITDPGSDDGITVSKNIHLAGFELNCNDYRNGGVDGIIFKKTGDIEFHRLHVHHCGGTGIRWSFDQDNAGRIRIDDCIVEYCHQGDGMQGVGDDIVISNCSAFSCGDTCYATIWDWSAASGLKPSNIVISNCKAKGEWVNASFTGAGKNSQLGFGFGPYGTGVNVYAKLDGCTCENLYSNAWFPVFSKLVINDCTFKPHANSDGAGVRLDGVINAVITGNLFECDFTGSTYFSALAFQFGRFTYGASNFDSDCKILDVVGNTFQCNSTPAIVFYGNPDYGKLLDTVVSGNVFAGSTKPIQFLPLVSTGTDIFNRINISGNTCDSAAAQFIQTTGAAAQYGDIQVRNNHTAAIAVVSGPAANKINVVGGFTKTITGFPDNVATTIFTLNRKCVEVVAYVEAGNVNYSATARYVYDGTTARAVFESNGSNVILSLSGINVQAKQLGTGSAQTLQVSVSYLR